MKSNLAFLIVGVIGLSGCGLTPLQNESASRFGAATSTVGQFASDELTGIRNEIIKMNTDRVILYGYRDYADLDGAADIDDLRTRLALTKALKSYGLLLTTLVNDSQYDALRNASLGLSDSLSGVSGISLNNEQRNLLGSLVGRGGNLFINQRKAKHVKTITRKFEPVIGKICDLLVSDFKVQSAGGQGFIAAYQNTAGRLKNQARTVLSSRNKQYSTRDRERALHAYTFSKETSIRAKLVGKKATRLINDLKKSNAKLARVMDNDKIDIASLRALGGQAAELTNIIEIFSKR